MGAYPILGEWRVDTLSGDKWRDTRLGTYLSPRVVLHSTTQSERVESLIYLPLDTHFFPNKNQNALRDASHKMPPSQDWVT